MARKLNKSHPDCVKYKKEWDELWAKRDKELAEAEAKEHSMPPEKLRYMRDGRAMGKIDKKYSQKFRELQERYSYLYYDE